MTDKTARLTAPAIAARKGNGGPLVCLTAYTASMATLLDPHCDLLLVGDSVAMTVYGMDSTLGADIPMMARHGQAVVRATQKACVVVDLPFGTYQATPGQAFETAAQILRETGAQAVKLEGGAEMAKTIAFLTARGIPVMGHIGLQPQSVNTLGGYNAQGRDDAAAQRIRKDAQAVAQAGAFAVVIEGVAEPLAATITREIGIPTIGIGASPECDGQILVIDDLIGMTQGKKPRFVKEYATISRTIEAAVTNYAREVKARIFPGQIHTYAARTQAPASAAPVNDRNAQPPQAQAQPKAQTPTPAAAPIAPPATARQVADAASPAQAAPAPTFSFSAQRTPSSAKDAAEQAEEKPTMFAYNILRAIPRRAGRDE